MEIKNSIFQLKYVRYEVSVKMLKLLYDNESYSTTGWYSTLDKSSYRYVHYYYIIIQRNYYLLIAIICFNFNFSENCKFL